MLDLDTGADTVYSIEFDKWSRGRSVLKIMPVVNKTGDVITQKTTVTIMARDRAGEESEAVEIAISIEENARIERNDTNITPAPDLTADMRLVKDGDDELVATEAGKSYYDDADRDGDTDDEGNRYYAMSSAEDVVTVDPLSELGLYAIVVTPVGPGNATVSIVAEDRFGRAAVVEPTEVGHTFMVDVNHPPVGTRAPDEDGVTVTAVSNTGDTGGDHDAAGMSIRGFIAYLELQRRRGIVSSDDPISELVVGTNAMFEAGSFFHDRDLTPFPDRADFAEVLTYSWDLSAGGDKYLSLVINSESGQLTLIPIAASDGAVTVTVTATDEMGESASQDFEVTVKAADADA
jgi:hypothetical protein